MITLGKRKVGDGEPCFITFEAGATHDGLHTAKRLATLAAQAGADAIKFQIFNPDKLVADRKQLFSYQILIDRDTGRTETITEPLYDILGRRYLEPDKWQEVKQHSDDLGLAFFATVGFEEDIRLLEKLGCDSIKIASSDINHWPLIRLAARTGMCLQLDTGNATLGEIEEAVEVIRSEDNDNIVIHNCPSGYPARLDSINLNIIRTLKQLFPYPVAFSDHSPGWEMDIAAISLGANLVEKTITEDRMTRSVEHIFSLEPDEMSVFVGKMRELEIALGNSRRILHPEELKKRKDNRRSAFLCKPVIEGQKVSFDDIEFRRPGHGIAPNEFDRYANLAYVRNLPEGHMIQISDMK